MEIKLVTNQAEWDGWLKNQPQCSFAQSWDWGEILKAEGRKVERAQFMENDKIFGAVQFIYNYALGFEYLFCPKGPVIKDSIINVFNAFQKYITDKGIVFLRCEPSDKNGLDDKSDFKKTIDINPRATSILELLQTEEEILEKMHSKTRYNIRLAEKKNLTISSEKNFEVFWRLMNETGKRDHFHLHEKRHYEEVFKSSITKQFTATLEGKPVATVVLVGFNDTMTYLFGASSYEQRQLMAPHLLQWEAIKLAKKEGYHYYDLFGIAPRKYGFSGTDYEYDEKHQYAGVTRFKLGFGGVVQEQPGTYDLIVSSGKYKMYQALRKLRRLV